MKKWYRIGICLVLAICLLLLTACKDEQIVPAADDAQATEKNTQTQGIEDLTATNSGGNTEMQEKNDLPKTLDIQWNDSFFQVRGYLGLNDVASAEQVTYQRLEELVNDHSLMYEAMKPEGEYQTALFSLTKTVYPEEFFKDHSLIIMPVYTRGDAALEITDVHYADGVLKCSVKTWLPPEEEGRFESAYFYCFAVLDTVLPEGTQTVCDITEVQLDMAEHRIKLDAFMDKCIYYQWRWYFT